jgi:hypothetical protein
VHGLLQLPAQLADHFGQLDRGLGRYQPLRLRPDAQPLPRWNQVDVKSYGDAQGVAYSFHAIEDSRLKPGHALTGQAGQARPAMAP